MKLRIPVFLFLTLLLFEKVTQAFSQQIVFNKIFPPDGKSFKHVTGITQDLNGIMWFSTKKGLYRYDGYHMTSYKNDPLNPATIKSNSQESVYADPDGYIWIGFLGAGLDRFEPESGVFTHYQHDAKDDASLSNDTVTVIMKDRDGTLWVGTHGGLDRYNPGTDKFTHFRSKPDDPASLSYNQVRAIYEDREGILWIGTGSPYAGDGGGPGDGGLNRMNRQTGKFIRYLHNPDNVNSLSNNKIRAIYEDARGQFWIGTARYGLHLMNREAGTFERLIYDPKHPNRLSGAPEPNKINDFDHITFVTQDAAGNYWMGSTDAGLYCYNPSAGRVIRYYEKENAASGFDDPGAWWVYTSKDGILWISSETGNLYRINPLRSEIAHVVLPGGSADCFYEEKDGTFWVGSHQEIIRYNKSGEIIKRYAFDAANPASGDNEIRVITGDSEGNLWIGGNGGLALMSRDRETLTRIKTDPKNRYGPGGNYVFAIYEDRLKNLWLGTFTGLFQLNRKTGLFTRYLVSQSDTTGFGKNFFSSILQDKSGNLWIGSPSQGLHLFNPENGKFKTYLKDTGIAYLYEDSRGTLLAGTMDGLYRYDPASDNFVHFNDTGWWSEIYDAFFLVEDDGKYLWIGTSDGLIRLNPQHTETVLFGKGFGIDESGLMYGSCYKNRDGKLYFGDQNGYVSFFPAGLNGNSRPPDINLSNFRLADKLVKPDPHGPLKVNISKAREIRLGYDQNVFSIDFCVIDYANPDQNRQLITLENYDNNWHRANSESRAYYFNVPPGKYVFRVKGATSNGVWAEKKIDIIIMPPWWRSWWAYCIYGLGFVAAVFGVDRFQRRRVVRAERERTRVRELAQAKEIEKAYTELKATQVQLIQAEKMASLGELTAGIAHEIQNPLNFVNNFSEINTELIHEIQEELSRGNLDEAKAISADLAGNEQKILEHGKRADAIVKGMLQHSRSSTGIKEPVNINVLADEYLRLAFHGLRARDKSFSATMKTDYDENIGTVNIIPQDIGRVILNLITNAFYAVNEKKKLIGNGFEPTVTVTTSRLSPAAVEIRVNDNGNGIPAKVIDKIFQPFFTTKPAGQGTGLGLSMSYDIITKGHGGELKVETQEGQSAEFIIVLPV